MQLTSSDFSDGEFIPEVYSFEEGDGINPELRLRGIPDGTKSLALVMDDIDAPSGSFIHWIVFDIPVAPRIERDSIPGKQGTNSAKRKNYAGPRPPPGSAHRYVFTAYALDTVLGLPEGTDKDVIMEAMRNHIIAETHLTGKYARKAQEEARV